MDQSTGTGFFRQNKGLELGFMVIGIALFIVLGVRGLQRIGDIRVAAGERNRSSTVHTNEDFQAEVRTAAPTLSTLSLEGTAKNNSKEKDLTSQGREDTEKNRPQPKPSENADTSASNAKKQNI